MPRQISKTTAKNGKSKTSGTASTNGNGNGAAKSQPAKKSVVAIAEQPPKKDTAAIDDPVRMYLMQMGEIPMLTRDMEVTSAKKIESTRTHFRRTLLCNDFMLHGAAELLQKVADGNLRLDRTIEISVTNTAEKKRVLKRIGPNLNTIRSLLAQNKLTFASPSAVVPLPHKSKTPGVE